MFREAELKAVPGLPAVLIQIVAGLGGLAMVMNGAKTGDQYFSVGGMLVIAVAAVAMGGLFVVDPGDAKVLVLFGAYKGTIKSGGFYWANPFLTKRRISLRIRNFETTKLKVNDNRANPIEIAAIVVWKVVETAEALFEVDDYTKYVAVQSESAVRAVAQRAIELKTGARALRAILEGLMLEVMYDLPQRDDVAEVVAFLASDGAAYITGQAINVSGGSVMH